MKIIRLTYICVIMSLAYYAFNIPIILDCYGAISLWRILDNKRVWATYQCYGIYNQ